MKGLGSLRAFLLVCESYLFQLAKVDIFATERQMAKDRYIVYGNRRLLRYTQYAPATVKDGVCESKGVCVCVFPFFATNCIRARRNLDQPPL